MGSKTLQNTHYVYAVRKTIKLPSWDGGKCNKGLRIVAFYCIKEVVKNSELVRGTLNWVYKNLEFRIVGLLLSARLENFFGPGKHFFGEVFECSNPRQAIIKQTLPLHTPITVLRAVLLYYCKSYYENNWKAHGARSAEVCRAKGSLKCRLYKLCLRKLWHMSWRHYLS